MSIGDEKFIALHPLGHLCYVNKLVPMVNVWLAVNSELIVSGIGIRYNLQLETCNVFHNYHQLTANYIGLRIPVSIFPKAVTLFRFSFFEDPGCFAFLLSPLLKMIFGIFSEILNIFASTATLSTRKVLDRGFPLPPRSLNMCISRIASIVAEVRSGSGDEYHFKFHC